MPILEKYSLQNMRNARLVYEKYESKFQKNTLFKNYLLKNKLVKNFKVYFSKGYFCKSVYSESIYFKVYFVKVQWATLCGTHLIQKILVGLHNEAT